MLNPQGNSLLSAVVGGASLHKAVRYLDHNHCVINPFRFMKPNWGHGITNYMLDFIDKLIIPQLRNKFHAH